LPAKYEKPVRIGVNWGSLDQDLLARIMDENARRPDPRDAIAVMREAMVSSALESAARAEAIGLPADRIILSCKVSGVQDLIAIYRELSRRCDYPAAPRPDRSRHGFEGHRRVDGGDGGAVAGRHWRHHPCLTDPRARRPAHAGGDRRPGDAADHGFASLHADGHVACPGCGRTTSTFFQELAQSIQESCAQQHAAVAGRL
jgi:(E)-4-hydroxy-3-methylbut-2-enyl-diphosphate synthase